MNLNIWGQELTERQNIKHSVHKGRTAIKRKKNGISDGIYLGKQNSKYINLWFRALWPANWIKFRNKPVAT